MKSDVISMIKNHKILAVIFDIDGTLKNLVLEHTIALEKAMNIVCSKKRKRKKLAMLINKIGMCILKTGLTPTNEKMQHILIRIFSMLLGVSYHKFITEYELEYNKQNIFFEDAYILLKELNGKVKVFFATVNVQNLNLNNSELFKGRIYCSVIDGKMSTYRDVILKNNLNPSEVLIVGDTLYDDVIPAKILKTQVVLVNIYQSKVKKLIRKTLKV